MLLRGALLARFFLLSTSGEVRHGGLGRPAKAISDISPRCSISAGRVSSLRERRARSAYRTVCGSGCLLGRRAEPLGPLKAYPTLISSCRDIPNLFPAKHSELEIY